RAIDSGEWPVKSLNGVNQETGEVFFTASMRDGRELPIEQQLCRTNLREDMTPVAVTPAGGWWSASMNRTGTAYVGNYSDLNTPPRSGLYRADGSLIRWIEENRLDEDHPYFPFAGRKGEVTYGTLESHGHTLVWQMTTPPGFDPSKTYPVVMQVYGGPSGGGVRKSWQSATNQLLTEAGYVIFRLDNRGEGDRSAAFKEALYLKMGQPEIEDQVLGANYLRSLPFVDDDRIAAMGWSYGGFMTLHMLTEPEMGLAAAAVGAPVTDWSLYDTHYTERFMSTPEANPEGYAASDVLPQLGQMTGRMLLM